MQKVSVILPFRNAKNTLFEAIQSVVSQQYINFEFVLVDNNSSDGSTAIADGFASQYDNVILARESREGVVHATNTGIKYCSGRFIARMDADDICLARRLEQQANFLASNPLVDFVGGLVKPGESDQPNDGLRSYVDWSNNIRTHNELYLNQFVEYPIVNPTVMVRREVFDDIGLYRDGNFPEDYEFFLRAMACGKKMHKLDIDVLVWNDFRERLTRTASAYSREAFQRIKTKYLVKWLNESKTNFPVWVWGAGKLAKRWTSMLVNEGVAIEGFIEVDAKKVHSESNVIDYRSVPSPGNMFIISLVSNRGRREEIRAFLEARGYEDGVDFILAA